MSGIHRHSDSRSCGTTTVVVGQSNVYANGLLVSVDGDPNTYGESELIATSNKVYVNNKLVVSHGPDAAKPDGQGGLLGELRCDPETASGSPNVFVGD